MEKLASDVLEEEFIKVFEFIHWTQYLVGFHRVKIEHKYVTAPSVYYKMYSSILWGTCILSAIYFAFKCDSNLEGETNLHALKIGVFIEVAINAIIAFKNNFYSGNLNGQLYVKLQKIDRTFKPYETARINRRIFLLSAFITAVFIVVWMLSASIYHYLTIKELCPAFLFIQVTGIAPCMEVVLVSYILLYLAVRLDYINVVLKKESKKLMSANLSLAATEYYREKEHDYGELAVAVHGILDSWTDCIRLFQFPIFSFTCQIIVWDFTLMLCVVTAIKDKSANTSYIIMNTILLILAMTSIFILSLLASFITSTTRLTKKLCSNVLSISSKNGDKIQKKAQHILMLLETSTSFSIYDIYTMDNRLPLHIFAITATYTIVLLQFATL